MYRVLVKNINYCWLQFDAKDAEEAKAKAIAQAKWPAYPAMPNNEAPEVADVLQCWPSGE